MGAWTCTHLLEEDSFPVLHDLKKMLIAHLNLEESNKWWSPSKTVSLQLWLEYFETVLQFRANGSRLLSVGTECTSRFTCSRTAKSTKSEGDLRNDQHWKRVSNNPPKMKTLTIANWKQNNGAIRSFAKSCVFIGFMKVSPTLCQRLSTLCHSRSLKANLWGLL